MSGNRFITDFKTDHCVIIDKENDIICEFEKHKFNDTQKYDYPENITQNLSPFQIARIMTDIADYLAKNHRDMVE